MFGWKPGYRVVYVDVILYNLYPMLAAAVQAQCHMLTCSPDTYLTERSSEAAGNVFSFAVFSHKPK